MGTISGSGNTYTFNVTPTTPETATKVSIGDDVAQDYAGNGNFASGQFSMTYTRPTAEVTSITRADPSPTAMTQLNYLVIFSRSITGLTTDNFLAITNGPRDGLSVTGVTGSGDRYIVSVYPECGWFDSFEFHE